MRSVFDYCLNKGIEELEDSESQRNVADIVDALKNEFILTFHEADELETELYYYGD